MFCGKCGFKNDDDAEFCAQCGEKIDISTDIRATLINENDISSKNKKVGKIVVFLMFVAVLIIVTLIQMNMKTILEKSQLYLILIYLHKICLKMQVYIILSKYKKLLSKGGLNKIIKIKTF